MIAGTMGATAAAWVAEGAPAFDVQLLTDGPEAHDGRAGPAWRARFALSCPLVAPWTLKRLAYALSDWLADGPFLAAVLIDAAADDGRATFDVAVWHPGGGSEVQGSAATDRRCRTVFSAANSPNFFLEDDR